MTRAVDDSVPNRNRSAVAPYGPGRTAAAFFNSSASTV